MSGARGVIYQCAACRSLVSARDVVVDAANERAALACDACGARTWLPMAGTRNAAEGAHVVDVEAGAASTSLHALPVGNGSTALVPVTTASATTALASTWSDEQRTRIAARLEKLAPGGDAQGELATTFNKLLTTWSNEAEHKSFLTKASLVNELAFAGQRYRAVLEEAPSDERAKKAQSDILVLAMASMSREKDFGSAGPEGVPLQKKLLAAAIVLVGLLVCIGILIYLPRILDPSQDPEVTFPGGEATNPDGSPGDGQGEGQNIAVPAPGR